MKLIIAIGLLSVAMLLFFALSAKQRSKTQQSHFSILTRYPKIFRYLAVFLVGLATFPLCSYYGNSIGFIALYLISTPILLSLIILQRN